MSLEANKSTVVNGKAVLGIENWLYQNQGSSGK